ncbi:MAG: hypothetical protein II921_05885, partial [Treponema sp.]|nr:hypothetical protein [Treponema sp.]
MSRTALDTAKRFIKRRKFAEALKILEDSTTAEDYKEVYDYFFTTGVAYLYEGEIGNAKAYFEKANRIRLTDPLLMDMFAVLHLRNRDTINATCKYLEAQDYDPEDVLAKRGLEFLKNKGTPEEIARLLSSGEIKKFYPPLGVNPDIIMFSVLAVVFGVLLAIGIL